MRTALAFTLATASFAITLPAHAQSSQMTCTQAQTSIQKFLDEGEVRAFVQTGLQKISEQMAMEGRQDATCAKMMESAERIFAVEQGSRERMAAEEMGVSQQPERVTATDETATAASAESAAAAAADMAPGESTPKPDDGEAKASEESAAPAGAAEVDTDSMTVETSEDTKSSDEAEEPRVSGDELAAKLNEEQPTAEAYKEGSNEATEQMPAASSDTERAESAPAKPADADAAAAEDTKTSETVSARMPSALESRTVESLIGKEVATATGDDLGSVDMVVIYQGAPYLIVSHGGFLSIGETEVGVRADKFTLSDDGETLMLPGLTEEEFDSMADWNEDDFPEAPEAATIGALYKN